MGQSLGDLAARSLEARCRLVLDTDVQALHDVRQSLRDDLPIVSEIVSVDELAWAVAFNIAPPPTSDSASDRHSGYLARWSADTPWDELWSVLVAPRIDRRGASTTLLRELACSVACERRVDWWHPASPRRDERKGDLAFEAIYSRCRGHVVREVTRRFGTRAGEPEAIADDAWSRVYRDYWSTAARRRFAGLSRIVTLVCQVAAYGAIDVLRQRGHETLPLEGGETDDGTASRIAQWSVTPDPVDRMEAVEVVRRVRRCVGRLPARQQVLVELVWFQDVKAVEAARLLEISEPAVSQMLKRARAGVQSCLGQESEGRLPAAGAAPAPALSSPAPLRLVGRRNDADRR